MMDIITDSQSELVIRSPDGLEKSVALYSEEGVELLTALRLKQMAEFKTMYEPTWLGLRTIQVPNDIVAMHELIWRVRPQVIIEIGVAHGGSLVMYAGLCRQMGQGRVLGIDVEIRAENRRNIENHEFASFIELYEGSSIERDTFDHAKEFCRGATETIVILDSNHSSSHVLREIELYSGLVSESGYLVVMDGGQAFVSDIPRGKPSWREDNPLIAIRQFLATNSEFETDPHFTRFGVTSCPDGFLRRKS